MNMTYQYLSPSFLGLKLSSNKHELVRIEVKNKEGEVKITINEEVNLGINLIDVDLSSLPKGKYTILIYNTSGKIKSEEFIKA